MIKRTFLTVVLISMSGYAPAGAIWDTAYTPLMSWGIYFGNPTDFSVVFAGITETWHDTSPRWQIRVDDVVSGTLAAGNVVECNLPTNIEPPWAGDVGETKVIVLEQPVRFENGQRIGTGEWTAKLVLDAEPSMWRALHAYHRMMMSPISHKLGSGEELRDAIVDAVISGNRDAGWFAISVLKKNIKLILIPIEPNAMHTERLIPSLSDTQVARLNAALVNGTLHPINRRTLAWALDQHGRLLDPVDAMMHVIDGLVTEIKAGNKLIVQSRQPKVATRSAHGTARLHTRALVQQLKPLLDDLNSADANEILKRMQNDARPIISHAAREISRVRALR